MSHYKIDVDGEVLGTPELARRVGITAAAMRKRIRRHGAGSKIVTAPRGLECVPRHVITLRGKSVVAASRDAGLGPDTVYRRLSRGATEDEALAPVGRKRP